MVFGLWSKPGVFMIGLLIVTHGNMGQDMLRCAEAIVGKQPGVWVLGLDAAERPDSLERRMEKTLSQMQASAGVLVLVDMMGGTPCNVSLRLYRHHRLPFDVVTGVNLPMMISALTNRHYMPIDQLAQKLVDDAARNICRPVKKLKSSLNEEE